MAAGEVILCDATGWESGHPQESAWPRVADLASQPDPDSLRLEVVLDAAVANSGNYHARVGAGESRSGGIYGNSRSPMRG